MKPSEAFRGSGATFIMKYQLRRLENERNHVEAWSISYSWALTKRAKKLVLRNSKSDEPFVSFNELHKQALKKRAPPSMGVKCRWKTISHSNISRTNHYNMKENEAFRGSGAAFRRSGATFIMKIQLSRAENERNNFEAWSISYSWSSSKRAKKLVLKNCKNQRLAREVCWKGKSLKLKKSIWDYVCNGFRAW